MNTELIAYYINLLILQYRSKPRAQGTIEALITALMIFDVIRQVENGFDVDTAIGAQQDIIAKYVGTQRVVTPTSDAVNFFASIPYADISANIVGFVGSIRNDVTTLPPYNQLTYETNIASSVTLTDTEFRLLIQAKIFQNTMSHTVDGTFRFLQEFFPANTIFSDNLNMTITYIFNESVRRTAEIFLAEDALPRPAGVALNVAFLPQTDSIFSFLRYNNTTIPAFADGFLQYSDPPSGTWIRY